MRSPKGEACPSGEASWRRRAVSATQATRHASAASRRMTPESCASRRPFVGKGAGKTGRRLAPAVRCAQFARRRMHSGIQGSLDIPAFPAQWFDGLWRALPGERCTIAPVALRMADARTRSGRHIAASLDAQTPGVRTTRFCRTLESHRSCARRSTAHGPSPPCDHPARRCAPRPPPPGPRIVTIAKRPLSLGWGDRCIRYFRISVNRNFSATIRLKWVQMTSRPIVWTDPGCWCSRRQNKRLALAGSEPRRVQKNCYCTVAFMVITEVPCPVGPFPVNFTAKASGPLYPAFAVY